MDWTVLAVFLLVYGGMILGGLPGLALDRTGVALLGALALVGLKRLTPADAWGAVDIPTMALLFGLMVISAQFRLGGFYTRITRALAATAAPPPVLLALLVLTTGLLSAVLANDIVCLAVTPVLVEGCARRGLHPVPFVLALACAANVGSAATLIGNPQNMLIGQVLHLSFPRYLAAAAVPTVIGLALVWLVVCWRVRGRWHVHTPIPLVQAPDFSRWQAGKGLAVLAVVMGAFLFTPLPREVVALGAAAVLLVSRRMASRSMLALVDWQLLVLFISLFVVHAALATSGWQDHLLASLQSTGFDITSPGLLFLAAAVLSNIVSNVPAVMMLLPTASGFEGGVILALASTLAGNLFIVGSIANIIVVEQAAPLGVAISWRDHARVGIPVTLTTLAVAAVWLLARAPS